MIKLDQIDVFLQNIVMVPSQVYNKFKEYEKNPLLYIKGHEIYVQK